MNQINILSVVSRTARALSCALLLVSAACSVDVAGTTPPDQALFYPTTMELSANGRYIYVVNSNFNQTYSSGWLSIVDLDLVLAQTVTGNEAIINREAGGQLRIPNLGGEMAISADGASALIPHRGANPRGEVMITRVELNAEDALISCGDRDFEEGFTGRESTTDCDEDHLIRVFANGADDLDPEATPHSEPLTGQLENAFATDSFTWTDSAGALREMVAIGYLTSGNVRFYEYKDGAYSFVDMFKTSLSVTTKIGFHPGIDAPFLVAAGGSASASKVCTVDLARSFEEQDPVIYSHSQPNNGGRKIYGFDFSVDGEDLLVVNRSGLAIGSPGTDSYANSLVRMDARLERTTVQEIDGSWNQDVLRPSMTVTETVLLDGRATDVAVFAKANGQEVVAVTGFDNNKLSLFSSNGDALVLATRWDLDTDGTSALGVGEGPVALRHTFRDGKDLLLVLNFFDHSLSVFDISAQSASDYQLVMKVQNETN